jgi:hypothetical protein
MVVMCVLPARRVCADGVRCCVGGVQTLFFITFSLWIHFHVPIIYRHMQQRTYPRALRFALIAVPCVFFVATITLHSLHAGLDRRRYRGLAQFNLLFTGFLYVYFAVGSSSSIF